MYPELTHILFSFSFPHVYYILTTTGNTQTKTCTVIPNLYIDAWHANATGVYSGFQAEGTLVSPTLSIHSLSSNLHKQKHKQQTTNANAN